MSKEHERSLKPIKHYLKHQTFRTFKDYFCKKMIWQFISESLKCSGLLAQSIQSMEIHPNKIIRTISTYRETIY